MRQKNLNIEIKKIVYSIILEPNHDVRKKGTKWKRNSIFFSFQVWSPYGVEFND